MKKDEELRLSGKMIEIPLKAGEPMLGVPKEGSPEWERAANRLARDYCPPINPCPSCGWPKIQGYLCQNNEREDKCPLSS